MKIQEFFRLLSTLIQNSFYLFILCVISRLITSINYLEDIDSMRFALSLFDYDILELRPHFPGYPMFCFFAKIIYFLTGSVQITFSIIGGIATFLIIYYSNLIYELITKKKSSYLSVLIFFNPLIWNLGNRYMSDLFGLSLLITITYFFFLGIHSKNRKQLIIAIFLVGILSGVRISFLPFFIPFFLFVFFQSQLNFINSSAILLAGVMVWMIPLIFFTGYENLYQISKNHISGHFFKWGGSVITSDFSLLNRLLKVIESIWADGVGGFWKGRSPLTIVLSIGWISSIYSFLKTKNVANYKIKILINILIASVLVYFGWIFLFQNVVYKPRHIIPFLPFILMLSSVGFASMIRQYRLYKMLIYLFICCLSVVTTYLNWQHKSPSAICQLKDYVFNDVSTMKIFCSSNLVNSYLKKHKGSENIVFLNENNSSEIKRYYKLGYNIYSTANLKNLNMTIKFQNNFYHNPYVNRLWSTMRIYQYCRH